MGSLWQVDQQSCAKTEGISLTCSWIIEKQSSANRVAEWEAGIIAPPLTIRSLADELHFHFRRYLEKEYSLAKVIPFLFLNLVQRFLYTYGFFIGRNKKSKSGRTIEDDDNGR